MLSLAYFAAIIFFYQSTNNTHHSTNWYHSSTVNLEKTFKICLIWKYFQMTAAESLIYYLLLMILQDTVAVCTTLCIISLYLATYLCNLYIWCNSLLGLSSSISTNAGLVTSPTLIEGAAVDSPSSTGWDLLKLILKLTKRQYKTCCLMKFFLGLCLPKK